MKRECHYHCSPSSLGSNTIHSFILLKLDFTARTQSASHSRSNSWFFGDLSLPARSAQKLPSLLSIEKKRKTSIKALCVWTTRAKCAHLAENRFVGLREELRQFFRVAEVQRQPVDAETLGVQVLLLAQLVDVHPLHHQRAIALHDKEAAVHSAATHCARGSTVND